MEGIVYEETGIESPRQAGRLIDNFASEQERKQSEDVDERRQSEVVDDKSLFWDILDDDDETCISRSEVPPPVGEDIEPHQWRVYYDVGLCGRLGLYCYNFQKGTNYEFEFVSELYTAREPVSFTKLLITLEAVNPDDMSPFTLKTCVKHDDLAETAQLRWETCSCGVEESDVWGKEADHEWDYEAVDNRYKGEMPEWLSDDDHQQCYVVEDSELMDTHNKWLHLFTEFAFYMKWIGELTPREIAICLPLEIQKVVVETRGKTENEPRDKLKAANAFFYISFSCGDDPMTAREANYRAVVRKTMDGKPGHVRLEVSCCRLVEKLQKSRVRSSTMRMQSSTLLLNVEMIQ